MEVLFCGIPNGRTQKVQHQAAHRLLNWQLYQRGCTDFTMEYGRLGKPSLQAYPQLRFVQYVLQNRYVLALCTTAPPEEPIHLLATSLERIPILAETETAHPVP